MGFFKKQNNIIAFSKQVQNKLMSVGGSATIRLLNGDVCHILLDKDNTGFISDKLNNYSVFYRLEVFDVIQELLQKKRWACYKRYRSRKRRQGRLWKMWS